LKPCIYYVFVCSTGDPKGVKTTHRNIMAVDEALIERFNITADDVSLHWMPLTHMVGVVFCHLLPVMTSTPQYLMNKNLYIQNPSFWVSKVVKQKATILLTANLGWTFPSTFKPEMAKRDGIYTFENKLIGRRRLLKHNLLMGLWTTKRNSEQIKDDVLVYGIY
jgi:hypothetical protein